MTFRVNPDWWKTLFDEVYLVTDARTVDNDETTRHEIDVYSRLLPMAPEDRILDLCGGHGRHTLEMCRRGYQHCTVLDYSNTLLRIGKNVLILSQSFPVCTDLVEIGDDTFLAEDTQFPTYRADSGYIRTGPVTMGRNVFVGEGSVLDIDTAMADDDVARNQAIGDAGLELADNVIQLRHLEVLEPHEIAAQADLRFVKDLGLEIEEVPDLAPGVTGHGSGLDRMAEALQSGQDVG